MAETLKYEFLGAVVNGPPSDHAYLAQYTTGQQPLIQTFTTNEFSTGGFPFYAGNPNTSGTSDKIKFTGQTNFNSDWGATNSIATLSFLVTVDNYVSVQAHFNYSQSVGGTLHGTSVNIGVTDPNGVGVNLGWKINTDQPQPGWVLSPGFTLAPGENKVDFAVAVASNNWFTINNFDIDAPPFVAKPINISMYWKCIRAETVMKNGRFILEQVYTVGVDKEQSHTSTVATELGMSANANLGEVSFGLTASLKQSSSTTESIDLKDSQETHFNNEFPGDPDQDYTLMLWQAVLVYDVGNGRIVEQHDDTLIATRFPALAAPSEDATAPVVSNDEDSEQLEREREREREREERVLEDIERKDEEQEARDHGGRMRHEKD